MANLKELGIDFHEKSARILIATPALVDALLALNTRNRKPKENQVHSLRKDIRGGKFLLTNQGIGVSNTGVLNDGQHRLYALRDEGYPPVEILLVVGLSDESQAVVDRHAKRTQSDVVSLLMNQTVTNKMVATINARSRVRCTESQFSYRASKESSLTGFELAQIITEEGDQIAEIISACGDVSAFTTACILDYSSKTSISQAVDFGAKLKSGAGLSENDPIHRLREAFIKRKTEFSGGAQALIRTYSVVVSACIAHSRREPLQLLRAATSWDRVKKWAD